jgi:redox-sensitive bicupin YhaK (pirin superfamily)
MEVSRKVVKILSGHRTSDGAGVRLTRMFGHDEVADLDPFLLLDMFGSDRAQDYMAGFPLHPHRGIETVTYMLDGFVDHRDSIGNQGSIGPGDVQWMTAGRGIMHEEMPRRSVGWMRGFQLWVNLPRASKMIAPKYRDVKSADIPTVQVGPGAKVKVIAGSVAGVQGPVRDLSVPVEYLDVRLEPGAVFARHISPERRAFSVTFEGSMGVEDEVADVPSGSVALLGEGDIFKSRAGSKGARFLLISGTPLREPIAWGGPIVMNTREELERAFSEIGGGTFIKRRWSEFYRPEDTISYDGGRYSHRGAIQWRTSGKAWRGPRSWSIIQGRSCPRLARTSMPTCG